MSDQEKIELLIKALTSISMSMRVHPDCTKDSEFADMVSLAEEVIKECE